MNYRLIDRHVMSRDILFSRKVFRLQAIDIRMPKNLNLVRLDYERLCSHIFVTFLASEMCVWGRVVDHGLVVTELIMLLLSWILQCM